MDTFTSIFDWLGGKLTDLLNAAVYLLPDSPFTMLSNSEFSDTLAVLNWFVPFTAFVAIAETWLVAVATYYILQAVLRWAKAIN